MSVRIGVDTGGTFTDLVVVNESGIIVCLVKAPSQPSDPARAVLHAIEMAAARCGLSSSELIGNCSAFVHGSTVATNTVLEHKGAKVGLICTAGFRDSIAVRRGRRTQMWNLREEVPPEIVPRYLRVGIAERMAKDGTSQLTPSRGDVSRAVDLFRRNGVEAVAVSLYNAFLNPAHEESVLAEIHALWPEVKASCSSRIAPLMGEYERTSTTVLDAYLGPVVVDYLTNLKRLLSELGLASGRLYMAQSSGGLHDVDEAISRPVVTLLSGPAAGAAAARLFGRTINASRVIVCDMGGTSCDVILSVDGAVPYREQSTIAGYDAMVPMVDIHTVGTGGGTIARVMDGPLLRVGPDSAGSDPGPACYGTGESVTVTDAQVVLERIDPHTFAGGTRTLDARRSRRLFEENVGQPMALSNEDAALGVIRVAETQMVEAMRLMTIEKGYDPRGFVLIAAGGAAGLHAAAMARDLGIPQVYIPRQAPAFCAVGLLEADIRRDYYESLVAPLNELSPTQVAECCQRLHTRAMRDLRDFPEHLLRLDYTAAMHYDGHQNRINVSFRSQVDETVVPTLRQGFERAHEDLYGFFNPTSRVFVVHVHLTATIVTEGVVLQEHGDHSAEEIHPLAMRPMLLDATTEKVECALYEGRQLGAGHVLYGPAMIQEEYTTILVPPNQKLEVDRFGNYLLTVSPSS